MGSKRTSDITSMLGTKTKRGGEKVLHTIEHPQCPIPSSFLPRDRAVLFLIIMKYDRRRPQSGYKDKETPLKRTLCRGIIVITSQCFQIMLLAFNMSLAL